LSTPLFFINILFPPKVLQSLSSSFSFQKKEKEKNTLKGGGLEAQKGSKACISQFLS